MHTDDLRTPPLPEGLLLTARTLVAGLYAGRHRSIERGGASDFHDHRAYTPGDPLSRVDWRLAARSDRLQVRRHRQESQLTVVIALDDSASMGFASFDGPSALRPTKLRRAQELAAAVALLAVRQGERIGLVRANDERVADPGAGWPTLHQLIASLEGARAAGARGLDHALARAADLRARAGVVVAIGDALEDPRPLVEPVTRLRHPVAAGVSAHRPPCDVSVLHVVTDDELDIAHAPTGRYVDPERDNATRAAPRDVRDQYRARIRAHLDEAHATIAAMGCRHTLHRTSAPPADALRELFAPRAMV